MRSRLKNLTIALILFIASYDSIAGQNMPGIAEMERPPVLASAEDASRQVRIIHYSAEIEFNPDSTGLTCRESIVMEHTGNLDAPLVLNYQAYLNSGTIDSVCSSLGIDSALIYSDSLVVYPREAAVPGSIDTLSFRFTNRLEMFDNGKKAIRYYGDTYWCPFPANHQGYYTEEMWITAPGDLSVVCSGKLLSMTEVSPGIKEHHWVKEVPSRGLPLFIIDDYQVEVMEREGYELAIYHLHRPDSMVSRVAGWYFNAFEKYRRWFGPVFYQRINVVELLSDPSNTRFFSTPGTFFVEEGIFGGNTYLLLPTDFKFRKTLYHELAHQWWAHKVISIEHGWMTEAFAEYSAIMAEFEDRDSLALHMRAWVQYFLRSISRSGDNGQPLSVPGDNSSRFYYKGPWVLYMLENLMGEEEFLLALKEYQETYAYRETTLDEFFAVIARHCFSDLTWFRREWLEKPGYPSLTVRTDYLAGDEGLVGRLIIEQQSEPYYNIPMELGIYHPGEQQPEMVSFRIEGPVDTLLLEPGSMPESVVIDPFYKTLVDVIYRVETAVAPSGDIPRGEEGMEIEFYLDSTRTMREITVNYRVNGSAGDSVIVDPQSLSGGYGRAVLPPLPEGSRIEYYLKATDALGMEFLFPENAPQEYCSLGVSALPPPGQRAFVSFMLEDYRADEHLKQPDPFADYRYGLAGFDPVARENFAMLYGVGCEAAVIDRERMIYLAYNPGKQSLDLVDLGKWRLDRRIPLPAEAAPDQKHHVISYNRKLNKAYLIGFNSLWMVDLTRETVSPFQGIQPGPELNWNPSQLEFHEDLNTLLVNRGGEVFLIDTDTDEISRSFNISYQEMPHLRSESTMITLEMYPENRWYSPSSKRTGRYILNARHYRLGQEAEVIDSASCMIDFGNKILTGILGGQTVNFADELDLVIINVLQDNSNVLIWDLSGSSDTLYRFSIYPGRWRPSGVYLGKDGEAFCLVCCSSNTELLPISLNSMEIMGSGFSPFKFDNYDHPASTSCLVTGIMTLKTDLEPGDLNSDSRVDLSDLLELLEYLQDNSMPYNYLFDINRDRSIDIFDLLVLLRLLGS